MTVTRGWLLQWVVVLFLGVRLLAQQPEAGAGVPVSGEVASSQPSGQVPRLIRFGGTLKNAAGNPETGSVALTFALYETQENGSPLWLETQTVQLNEAGQYTVLLGATQPDGLPLDLFTSSRARWLSVQPQLQGEGEPARILLVGVPYALKAADADTLGGIPASAFLLAPVPGGSSPSVTSNASEAASQKSLDSAVSLAVTPCTAVASDGTASAGSIALFTAVACTIGGSAITQNGSVVDVAGTLQLPATNTATAAGGFNSNLLDLQASSFNSTGAGSAVAQDFQWVAEPVGNDTTSPSGKLNLRFGSNGATPAETGLSIASSGLITFASGQKFPGAGAGTVTSVGSGAGLTGGPITGTGTLSIAAAGVTNAMLANPSLTVTSGTDLTGGGAVALGNSVTLNVDTTKVPQLAAASNTFAGKITAASIAAGAAAFTGAIAGTTATFTGTMQAAGNVVPPLAQATTTAGSNSNPLDLQTSIYNTAIAGPVSYVFRWQAEPHGNDSTDTFGSLNLLYGVPGDISETGLSVAQTGIITFASGQTFPGGGGGSGTITGVTAGTDLTGGGTSGTVTLNLNTTATDARYSRLAAANTFTGNQSVTGNVAATGTVSGSQLVSSVATGTAPLVVSSTTEVTNLNAGLLGGKAAAAFPSLAAANTFTGNQSVTGNVAATGTVSGSQLVSSVASGTAPLVVTSTTEVTNLNAGLLGGKAATAFPSLAANTFTGNQSVTGNVTATGTVTATGNVSGKQLVASAATGTAPLIVSSTTEVTNLNAGLLGGKAATAFPSLAAANTFTGNQSVTGNVAATGSVSGSQLVSSVATGTAPLIVSSTTAVPNLDASLLGEKPAAAYAILGGGNTFTAAQNITVPGVGATALTITASDTTSRVTTGLVVTNDSKQSAAIVFKASAPNIGSGSSCTVFASGNLVCTGTKSAAVPLNNGRMAALYAVEAPENWFEDFGSGKLVDGIATVALDSAYAQTVNVNVSYHVFVTPKGDCEGLYVAKETPGGFEVRELRGGKSNVDFDYRIVARRRGYEAVRLADVTGQVSRPSMQEGSLK
jgi:hypothetical protein